MQIHPSVINQENEIAEQREVRHTAS